MQKNYFPSKQNKAFDVKQPISSVQRGSLFSAMQWSVNISGCLYFACSYLRLFIFLPVYISVCLYFACLYFCLFILCLFIFLFVYILYFSCLYFWMFIFCLFIFQDVYNFSVYISVCLYFACLHFCLFIFYIFSCLYFVCLSVYISGFL